MLLCDRLDSLNTHTHMEKAFTSVPISLASSENTVPCLNLRAVPSVLPMQASLVHLLSGMTSCRKTTSMCEGVCEDTCVNMQPITWQLNWSCDQALTLFWVM